MPSAKGNTARTAPPEERRKQLIDATISVIGEAGISGATLPEITRRAGLSLGLVNFHFGSKDGLIRAVLMALAEEHRDMWQVQAGRGDLSPAGKIGAIVEAQFHPRICNRRKLAVWFAFFGNPMHRKSYRTTATGIDDERMAVVTDLCTGIISEGDYSGVVARDVAATLEGLFDGLWLNILMYPDRFSAEGAKAKVFAYLAAIFPAHFGGHQVSGKVSSRREIRRVSRS